MHQGRWVAGGLLAAFAVAGCGGGRGESGGQQTTVRRASATSGQQQTATATTTRVYVQSPRSSERPTRTYAGSDGTTTRTEVHVVPERRSPPVVVVPAPSDDAPGHRLAAPRPQNPPPQQLDARPIPSHDQEAAFTCAGNQQLRIVDRVVDGERGAAIVASGNCRLEILESIVKGHPAVIVRGNARVRLIESKIRGDLVSQAPGRIDTRGCEHKGRVLGALAQQAG